MRLAVIIPDRGDRPSLLHNCMRMLEKQTVQPAEILLVDFKPTDEKKDITKRYRIGYEKLRGKGYDLIAFIENDDYYSPIYLETMLEGWKKHNRPDLFGTTYTIYYHITLKKWFTFNHLTRSSAMSTLIKPDLDITWPVDEDPYTDAHLWHYIKDAVTFTPKTHICLGIKHSIGLCGGANHFNMLDRYEHEDEGRTFLASVMDSDSFLFYTSLCKNT